MFVNTNLLRKINRIPADGAFFAFIQTIQFVHIISIKRKIVEFGIGVDTFWGCGFGKRNKPMVPGRLDGQQVAMTGSKKRKRRTLFAMTNEEEPVLDPDCAMKEIRS